MKTNKTPSAYQQLRFGLWSLPPLSSPGVGLQAGFCAHHSPPTMASSAQDPHPLSTPTPSSSECIRSSQHFWASVS